MNYIGIVIGAISFLSIGVFHPIVIKAEYYFSKNIWPAFALSGGTLLILSLLFRNVILSSCLAVIGMTCLWSIKELFDQEKRVEKGWFPKNPKRRNKG